MFGWEPVSRLDHWRPWLWLAALIFCVLFTVLQTWERKWNADLRAAWQKQCGQIGQRDRAAHERASQLVRSASTTRWPPMGDKARQALGDSNLRPNARYTFGRWLYTDPSNGGRALLELDPNRAAFVFEYPTPWDAFPPQPNFHNLVASVRRVLCVAGFILCAIYTLWMFAGPTREECSRRARSFLILALTCAWLSLLGIRSHADLFVFFEDEAPGWGICFVFLGLAALLMPWYPSKSQESPPLCETCGYNLTGNVSGICPECGTRVPELSGAKRNE
jgi:hypothetical protein